MTAGREARRPVVGIPFNYDENWIGGTCYVKNLVSSLALLPETEQPEVCLLSHEHSSFEFIRRASGYPRLRWLAPVRLQSPLPDPSRRRRLLRALTPWFLRRSPRFDVIFPFPAGAFERETVCWIPDFQDRRLPEFFSEEELAARERQHREFFTRYRHIVFSSQAAKADFDCFYPEAQVQRYVVHFAVFEPAPDAAMLDGILARQGLPARFFYCPNQFWVHKNHEVVIQAVALLKRRGIEVTVAFSGKEHDYRAPDHAARLKECVAREGVGHNIRFLGFLPRDEQMSIFRRAVSIIQPSLFEGWSTVIEDAKSLSQYVLASRIPANVEQGDGNIEYFEPSDAPALARLLEAYAERDPPRRALDYRRNQLAFASDFLAVVRSVMRSNAAALPA